MRVIRLARRRSMNVRIPSLLPLLVILTWACQSDGRVELPMFRGDPSFATIDPTLLAALFVADAPEPRVKKISRGRR